LAPVLLGAAFVSVILNRRGPPPPAKPNVVVPPRIFRNLTNDPALGTVLGKVLEIDLAQSPVSEPDVAAAGKRDLAADGASRDAG